MRGSHWSRPRVLSVARDFSIADPDGPLIWRRRFRVPAAAKRVQTPRAQKSSASRPGPLHRLAEGRSTEATSSFGRRVRSVARRKWPFVAVLDTSARPPADRPGIGSAQSRRVSGSKSAGAGQQQEMRVSGRPGEGLPTGDLLGGRSQNTVSGPVAVKKPNHFWSFRRVPGTRPRSTRHGDRVPVAVDGRTMTVVSSTS